MRRPSSAVRLIGGGLALCLAATVQLPATARADEPTAPAGASARADWVTVTASGVEIGEVTSVVDGTDRSEHATVSVPVTNTGTAAVRANVGLTLPDGWRSVSSGDTLLPPSRTTSVAVPVIVPLDLVGGSVPVTIVVRRGNDILAGKNGSIAVDLPRPPAATVIDHVDFGELASENAHVVQGSPSSGTNTEAGLTRRYADKGTPGASFSAQVNVPAGQPFVLRNVETFDAATTKKYDILVNDVVVKTQLVPRTESGAGTKVYDALIDHPSLQSNNGTVRVTFRYPTGAASFGDPSIADTYVLAVPADTQSPDVSAVVASGKQGDAGWYRSEVSVAVAAADNRTAAPVVETSIDNGWQGYVAPVALSGDGTKDLAYRATDAAGNRTSRQLQIGIDATAPATAISVASGGGDTDIDRATFTLAATDATSGVATTRYRLDGGPWTPYTGTPVTVQGLGEHVVEYASTDVAGNPEPVRQVSVTLADVDTVSAVLAPQVSGTARIGSRLTATTGNWNTKDLTFSHQWLRNGSPIPGATSASYVVGVADIGKRISVRVTASQPKLAPGTSTSAATAPVAKASSKAKATVNKTNVKRRKPVKVTAVVRSNPTATGRVAVVVKGRTVKTLTLKNGRATTQVRIAKRGRARIVARYLGSAQVARSTSPARTVRVR